VKLPKLLGATLVGVEDHLAVEAQIVERPCHRVEANAVAGGGVELDALRGVQLAKVAVEHQLLNGTGVHDVSGRCHC